MISPRLRVAAIYGGAAVAIAAVGLLRHRTDSVSLRTPASQRASATAQVRARMAAESHDVERETTMAFVLYFPSEGRARDAAATLERTGWSAPAVERPEEPGGDWQLTVARRMAPTLAALDSVERALEPVARRFGGAYDGWEADAIR